MRRLIAAGLLAVVLLALGYGLYWHVAAGALEDGIARWTAERRAEGYQVSFVGPEIGGFPFRLEARLDEPMIEAPHGAWRWRGPAIRGEAAPWSPLRIDFAIPGRHELIWRGAGRERHLQAEAAAAEGGVTLSRDGQVERVDIDARGLEIRGGGDRIAIAAATGSVSLPATPPDNGKSAADFSVTIGGLTLPEGEERPLGGKIQRIAAEGSLIGAIPPGPPQQALAAWRDAGGTLELRRFAMAWGPLHLAGNGTFALDEAMRPLAAMTATVSGHGETLDALVAEGVVRPREGSIARLLLTALSHKPKDGGPPELKVALTAQQGYLYVGPIKLIPLPPLQLP